MRCLPVITMLLVVACLAAAPGSAAHELQASPPGPVELDAGTAEPARLVHATLVDAGDQLVVTATPTGGAVEAVLLVPDRDPERDLRGGDLPSMRIDGGMPVAVTTDGEPLVDEATGFVYRELGRIPLDAADGKVRIVVARGDEPLRIALRVGMPTSFAATDVDRTPRTFAQSRAWFETPAPGADVPKPPTVDRGARTAIAWFGAALALSGVGVAAWWLRSGRSTARRRGIERDRP
jgi:hypothetical protein